MFKKIIFIVLPIIVVTTLIFVFGISYYNSRYISFQKDGHVLAKSTNSSTKKVFFDTDSKYKYADDTVYITDKDDKTVSIPKESFVHYTDGSVSTFSKAVVLDLDDLSKENYKYYNIFPDTIFVKGGNSYSVNYLDKKLTFSNFLLKINNDKYMIIGKKMKLKIGDVEKTFENNYLEVSYLDGKMIKIENQSVAFQSVDDQVTVDFGDNIIIDLSNKNVYKDSERKLALGEITIDSDDNIQINSEDNKSITGEKDEKDDTSSNGKSGGSGGGSGSSSKTSQLPNVNSGIVDTTSESLEQIIDENARIKDAEFKVIDMDVTANRLRASVQITDEDAVLVGDVNIKIIEASSNQIIYETNNDSGGNVIEIENESLSPETNYILVLNSDYKKNSMTYNKDFVQKTFITDAIGVSLEKQMVSDSELQLEIKKRDYSEVISVDVALMDANDQTITTRTVPLTTSSNGVYFPELEHNSIYKVKVYNFVYKDAVIVDGFTILKEYKTLKNKPSIGSTTFSIDKREGKFNMIISNVDDPDNGIVSYKYEVYENISEITEDSVPVSIIEKTNSASATLNVDGNVIKRGVPYIFRVVMEFNDNEKTYEYVSNFSNVMKLDGVEFPIIKFEEDEITFERIRGTIQIIDDGNTIDLNSPIIITYTDSVGKSVSNTFNSLTNAIDYNYLRSNESYIFSVTAKVDLQDGNPPIDSCYIGSVIVHTKDPNPFVAEFNESDEDANGFSVDVQLKSSGEVDASLLEANTLTKLYLRIYSGKNATGTYLRQVPFLDYNINEYISDLKGQFYDKSYNIVPATFGLKSNELNSSFYTIQIVDAVDYTPYPNNLPIQNNTYVVKTKPILPDLPEDPNNAADYIAIYNRDVAGTDRYREDLDDSTIIGYRIRANYDNSRMYAKTIRYTIHYDDGTEIGTFNYNVPGSGDIGYSTVYLGDGLESGVTDGNLHRGIPFYVSFEVDLDTDLDGETDKVYPVDSSVTLRSVTLEPERQEPKMTLYPSTMSKTKYNWKYTYSDVDNALKDKKLYSLKNNEELGSVEITPNDQYREASFNYSAPNTFSILGKQELVNGKPKNKLLASHYIEGVSDVDFGRVSLSPERNRVILSFLDYQYKEEAFKKISSVKLDFTSGNETVTLDGLSPKNGMITVNYSLMESLQGKNVTVHMTIYYDSGRYGFDNSAENYAIQQMRNSGNDFLYYFSFENNKFNTKEEAFGSYVTYDLMLNEKTLTVSDILSNTTNNYPIDINQYGISYLSTYISPKTLNSEEGKFEKDQQGREKNQFYFATIIPGISILNDDGEDSTLSLINSVSFKLTPYGMSNKLKDDKFYIELYYPNESGLAETLIKTDEHSISELDDYITIDDLIPGTDYVFKVYGYILEDGNYEKVYLYDVDKLREGVEYSFKTLKSVDINGINITYTAASYSERKLYISYNIAETMGIDHIEYKVYKKVGDEYQEMNMNIADSRPSKNVKMFVDIPNNIGFSTGETYKFEFIPVCKLSNGEYVQLDSVFKVYKFKDLYRPYFSILKSTGEDSISYRVNVRDYNKSIVNGNFRVQILDSYGNDLTPSEYVDVDYPITTLNQVFTLDDYDPSLGYVFNIYYYLDIHNDVSRIKYLKYTYNSNSGPSSDIDLGNYYAALDSEDSSVIKLSFFDSHDINKVKYLRYSIYDTNSFSIDNEVEFLPSLVTSSGVSYFTFKLPDLILNSGIYYLTLQFLDENGDVLAEDTLECRFI